MQFFFDITYSVDKDIKSQYYLQKVLQKAINKHVPR